MKLSQIVVLAVAAFGLATAQSAEKSAAGITITVHIPNVDVKRPGPIICALFHGAKGFPMDSSQAVKTQNAQVAGQEMVCVFHVTEPGEYAISVAHDENGNGKVDTNMLGIPKEGWGTSNNITHTFHAPSFQESKFTVIEKPQAITVSMHY